MYLDCGSAMQTHSWKIQNTETKLTKSLFSGPVRPYLRQHCYESCLYWWNPWTNHEMDVPYWSQASSMTPCVPPEVWDHPANNCLGKEKWVTGSCFTSPLILHVHMHTLWLHSLQQLVKPHLGSMGQQPLQIAWSTHCLQLAGKGALPSNKNVDWVPAGHSGI